MFPSKSLRHSIALSLLALASAAVAAEPLTLSQALATALQKNPTLKVHSFATRIAEARILQAGLKPNPELSVQVENFLGTGDLSGVKGLETTLQLSKVIDLAGSRVRRVETATASRELADADYETQRVNVFAEVARRFLDGVALSGVLPAPLIIFSTFVGYFGGGPLGALAMTAGIFLPAFLFSILFFHRFEAVVHNPTLHNFLEGVAAGVVGLIAITTIKLGVVAIPGFGAAAICVGALIVVYRWKHKLVVPAIMMVAGVAGVLLFR